MTRRTLVSSLASAIVGAGASYIYIKYIEKPESRQVFETKPSGAVASSSPITNAKEILKYGFPGSLNFT
jgi:hypothetical protein